MTSDDAGGLTVDLKLFKQLIKKKKSDVANQIGYRLQLMHLQTGREKKERDRAGERERKRSHLVSKRMPAGVRPIGEKTLFIGFSSFFMSHY